MNTGSIENPEGFVNEFLEEYLSDGMGAKTKREIDILVMNLLMKYGGAAEKSNQELSILLQATEGKIKALRYEARLKYPPEADYVKKEFLNILMRSQFDLDKGKIIFVMEDEYLRHAIQGRLKLRGMYADTSFNTELIKIDKNSLKAVIGEVYGQEFADNFQTGINEMEDQLKKDQEADSADVFANTIMNFAAETAKSLLFEIIKGRIGM